MQGPDQRCQISFQVGQVIYGIKSSNRSTEVESESIVSKITLVHFQWGDRPWKQIEKVHNVG